MKKQFTEIDEKELQRAYFEFMKRLDDLYKLLPDDESIYKSYRGIHVSAIKLCEEMINYHSKMEKN
jgi:hypothetical protein